MQLHYQISKGSVKLLEIILTAKLKGAIFYSSNVKGAAERQ